jgi:hypothetical protein
VSEIARNLLAPRLRVEPTTYWLQPIHPDLTDHSGSETQTQCTRAITSDSSEREFPAQCTLSRHENRVLNRFGQLGLLTNRLQLRA